MLPLKLTPASFTMSHNQCTQGTVGFYKHHLQDFQLCPENDAMLAYDATSTMLYAMDQVMIAHHNNSVTADNLWNALKISMIGTYTKEELEET